MPRSCKANQMTTKVQSMHSQHQKRENYQWSPSQALTGHILLAQGIVCPDRLGSSPAHLCCLLRKACANSDLQTVNAQDTQSLLKFCVLRNIRVSKLCVDLTTVLWTQRIVTACSKMWWRGEKSYCEQSVLWSTNHCKKVRFHFTHLKIFTLAISKPVRCLSSALSTQNLTPESSQNAVFNRQSSQNAKWVLGQTAP